VFFIQENPKLDLERSEPQAGRQNCQFLYNPISIFHQVITEQVIEIALAFLLRLFTTFKYSSSVEI